MISVRTLLIFLAIFSGSARSLPITIDILENRDIIFPRRSELVKRTASNDVSEFNQQKVSLSSFIENIETGILQTALSIEPLATDTHAEVQSTSTTTTTTAHPVEKRSTNDDTVDSSTPLVLVQTTEKVPAVDAIPSHVVIDRVSVFKAPEVGSGLFPTFLVQDTNTSKEATNISRETDDDSEAFTTPEISSEESDDSTESSESSESTESTESSESSDEESKKVTDSSTSSPSSSTTPLSVEDKKTVEKQLKEKVVEVEAEPVIFTARV